MRLSFIVFAAILLVQISCHPKEVPNPIGSQDMYFPPLSGNVWEKVTPASLGWNESQIPALLDFLQSKNSKSFLILVNGRIAIEEYFDGHKASDTWPWNSAGKTLTTATVGIAQQEKLVEINSPVSKYLGVGWTAMPLAKEGLITPKHLLSMNSGINDENQLVIRSNLTYLADAGSRWSYHNVFQRLMNIVGEASGQPFELYFTGKLKNKIGMDGFWNEGLVFTIYHSSTRSMARFGLLALNLGKWGNDQLLNEAFFKESISSSQPLNPAYGYLWWLNGKTQFMVPGSQTMFPGMLIPTAPTDLYAAMGAEDQRIYVIPSKKMVIIRMGRASDPQNPNFALSGFDVALWEKINAVIN